MIRHICQLQLGWHPVAVVQYTFTHKQYIEQHKYKQYIEQHKYKQYIEQHKYKQYIEQHNNNRTTQIHNVTTNLEECGPCPVFASFTPAFALQLRKNTEKLLSG